MKIFPSYSPYFSPDIVNSVCKLLSLIFCSNVMNSGPSNFTSIFPNSFSINFNCNSFWIDFSSDEKLITKFVGLIINFALYALAMSSLPEPDSWIENSFP